MNPELLMFPSSLVGGHPRPRRPFTDPFSSPVPSWGDVPEADSEVVPMAPLRRLRSCFFDDGPRSEIREGDLAIMRRKYAIHPSVGMRSPTDVFRERGEDELLEATKREAELQRQINGLQSQETELHKTLEETNPEISLEFQSLKEKLNELFKQLEQSAEKLSQLKSKNLNLRDENQALNTASNKKHGFHVQVRPMLTLETPNYGMDANLPPTASGGDASTREKAKDAHTYDVEDSESEPEPDKEAPDGATKAESPMSMVESLPGVAPPIRKSNPDSYADTPFTDEITLIEMPRKFSFPSIKVYDRTTDPDDHVAQYRQRMLAAALPKGSREATMCKGFGSTLTGPALQWVYQSTLQHRAEPLRGYIARFNQEKVAIPECSIPTAISAFKRGLLPDGDLYKELTKYQCKTMEDVLSRAWTQNRPIEKAEGMAVSTWPDISHLSVSRPELINVLRQIGQQVKWPQKIKAPDSFRNHGFWSPVSFQNLGFWCDCHRDHGHKTEDCIALKIELNELVRKGHLREFLSEKAKSHLSKETTGKPTEAAPVSPPRQDRVIHVISGGSETSGIIHAAAKKSTWNAKHGLEAAKPKRLLLGTDEISFTAKEHEKVLTLHHDALVISLTLANCLAAYKDLGLEESALTRRISQLIGFSGEVKQTAEEVTLPV
uniref:Retrotransposon gag domain-containing protein n=1 Tax=Brassica oleracea var. oleracea TaxID=109376 RepID=A0A0D3BVE8_BRAOL